jgi:hypothetical protein
VLARAALILAAATLSAGTRGPSVVATPRVARLAFDLGSRARLGDLRDRDLLYGCAELAECARGCGDALVVAGRGGDDEGAATACPALRRGTGDLGSRARALVRARLEEAGREARVLDARSRDALECGLGRLSLAPARPVPCAREEARLLAEALESAALSRGRDAEDFLLELCAELESCSGRCAGALRAATSVDWSSVSVSAFARDLTADCPGLGAAVGQGPDAGARARAVAWGIDRLRGHASAVCPALGDRGRLEMACGLERLGAGAAAGCGAATRCAKDAAVAPRRRSGP